MARSATKKLVASPLAPLNDWGCWVGADRGNAVTSCDGSGQSKWCASTTPHEHCVCGLAMPQGVERCGLCVLEDTVPIDVESQMEWDGRTYPSWRNRRRLGPSGDAYILLARAIGEGMKPRDYALSWRLR